MIRFAERSFWEALFKVATGKASTIVALECALRSILERYPSTSSTQSETRILIPWKDADVDTG